MELHIDSLSVMLPYIFGNDRINYARWASVYLADMKSLSHSAAEVYDEFMNGNHPVKRVVGSFNQVWIDQALEQPVNRDSKVSCLGDSYAVNNSCKSAIERLFCAAFGSKHENVYTALHFLQLLGKHNRRIL